MALDFAALLDQINSQGSAASEDVSGAMGVIAQNNAALTQSYQQSTDRANQVATSTKTVADVKNSGALQAQNALQNFAAEVGGDTADATGLQAQLAATFLSENKAAADKLAVITQKRSVSFLDDPLEWISNKLTINDDINEYNAHAVQANQAEAQIASTSQLIDLRANAQAKIATTVTAASAQAASQIAVASAQENAAQLARQGYVQNTQGVKELADMSYRKFQTTSAIFDADARYESLKHAQAQLALSYQSMDLEQKRFALQQQKEVDANGANQYIADNINAGLKVLYPTNPAAWNVPAGKLQAILTGKVPLSPELKKAMELGEQNKDLALPQSGVRILGITPADALDTLKYSPTLSPDQQAGVAILKQAQKMIDTKLAGQQITSPAQLAEYNKAINDQANLILAAAANHTQDPTSAYYLPPVDKIVQAIPAAQQDPVWTKVLGPLAVAKVDLSNPDQVAGYVSGAVKAGTISLNDGAQFLSNVYINGQKMNMESKQLKGLGLTPKISYIANSAGAGWAGKTDFTDPTAVMKDLMGRSAAAENLSAAVLAGSGQ
jgi:hypothetical protein